jgi:cytochrome P450
MQKLLASPWLQAVYTETLRRHSVYFITRDVTRNIEIDGYTIPPGSMVQAPMLIAHYNNSVWDTEGHSADEFWPQRHLKNVGEKGAKVEFALGSRGAYWFPYGGGPTMCPGRHFARQEIIMTIALFASRFDVEVVGWTMRDGSPSDHGPKNGDGIVIAHPDRDMKIRIKRRW